MSGIHLKCELFAFANPDFATPPLKSIQMRTKLTSRSECLIPSFFCVLFPSLCSFSLFIALVRFLAHRLPSFSLSLLYHSASFLVKKIFMGSENLKKFSHLKRNPIFAGSCFRVIILTGRILKKIFVPRKEPPSFRGYISWGV